jgi:hypothetical protein
LQDVFYELVEANRLLMPIEHVTGWLSRVAHNRIADLFRKKKTESFSETAVADEDEELLLLEDLLPSPDAGPEALYARNLLLAELELAVDCRRSSAGPRSPSGKRWGFWRCARSSSVDLGSAAPAAPGSAAAWQSVSST